MVNWLRVFLVLSIFNLWFYVEFVLVINWLKVFLVVFVCKFFIVFFVFIVERVIFIISFGFCWVLKLK